MTSRRRRPCTGQNVGTRTLNRKQEELLQLDKYEYNEKKKSAFPINRGRKFRAAHASKAQSLTGFINWPLSCSPRVVASAASARCTHYRGAQKCDPCNPPPLLPSAIMQAQAHEIAHAPTRGMRTPLLPAGPPRPTRLTKHCPKPDTYIGSSQASGSRTNGTCGSCSFKLCPNSQRVPSLSWRTDIPC
jgi:hypothetical protein